jgi:hypothetical protein
VTPSPIEVLLNLALLMVAHPIENRVQTARASRARALIYFRALTRIEDRVQIRAVHAIAPAWPHAGVDDVQNSLLHQVAQCRRRQARHRGRPAYPCPTIIDRVSTRIAPRYLPGLYRVALPCIILVHASELGRDPNRFASAHSIY